VGQEECPLSLTEDLPLFRINSKRIKKDHSHWKQGYSDSILLLTNNERIDTFGLKKRSLKERNGRYESSEYERDN